MSSENMKEEEIANIFKVLSVEARVKIFLLLKEKPYCSGALAYRLGMTPAAVSQHLRILSSAGVVKGKRMGNFVHYTINDKVFSLWKKEILKILQ